MQQHLYTLKSPGCTLDANESPSSMIYIHIYNILFFYALVPHASAADFTPSPSWRVRLSHFPTFIIPTYKELIQDSNIVGSPKQRIDIASAALEVAIGQAQFNG